MRTKSPGFTLIEILVSISVLALVVLMIGNLFNSATKVTSSGNNRMDADANVRPLMNRIKVDFEQMLKRADIDCYLKSPADPQSGNDQITFFSQVDGYYPATGSQSPVSLVSYRVNNINQMERMGKGLLWNGVSPSETPLIFLPSTITSNWPAATSTTLADTDYESAATQVFRFEYQYLLRNGTLSNTPWDTGAGHVAVAGFQDVAAISVVVATVDPRNRALMTNNQLITLSGQLVDFQNGFTAGELATRWRTTIDSTTNLPRPALAAIRIYERYFNLPTR